MNDEKCEAIIEFICEKYTGQEVMEALSKEYPTSYKTFCTCEGCKKDKRIREYKRSVKK